MMLALPMLTRAANEVLHTADTPRIRGLQVLVGVDAIESRVHCEPLSAHRQST